MHHICRWSPCDSCSRDTLATRRSNETRKLHANITSTARVIWPVLLHGSDIQARASLSQSTAVSQLSEAPASTSAFKSPTPRLILKQPLPLAFFFLALPLPLFLES